MLFTSFAPDSTISRAFEHRVKLPLLVSVLPCGTVSTAFPSIVTSPFSGIVRSSESVIAVDSNSVATTEFTFSASANRARISASFFTDLVSATSFRSTPVRSVSRFPSPMSKYRLPRAPGVYVPLLWKLPPELTETLKLFSKVPPDSTVIFALMPALMAPLFTILPPDWITISETAM